MARKRRIRMPKSKMEALAAAFVIWILLQPLLGVYLVNAISDWSTDVVYKYNAKNIAQVSFNSFNSTNEHWIFNIIRDLSTLSYIFDNDTMTFEVLTEYPADTSEITKHQVIYILNLTNIIDANVYKIYLLVEYENPYNANISYIKLCIGDGISGGHVSNIETIYEVYLGNTNKYNTTIELNTFQSLKFNTKKYVELWINVDQEATIGDYVKIQLVFIKKATVMSREDMLKWIFGSLAVINFVAAAFATNVLSWKDIEKLLRRR